MAKLSASQYNALSVIRERDNFKKFKNPQWWMSGWCGLLSWAQNVPSLEGC